MDNTEIHNDKQLLLQIANGDQQAFTTLFMYHRGRVYSTIYRLTASSVMAEEILQDVFLKIWIKRHELEAVSNFEAYLHTIARRATYRGLKQLAKEKQRLKLGIEENEPVFHLTGESVLQLKQYNSMLQQAMDSLPNKQRETFRLIREEGYKRAEVALKLGVSQETVKYNLDEALRKIRAHLIANGDFLLALLLISKAF